jgi:lipoprotein-anchoring transpeptidase ErfK/SrfK
MKPRDRTVLLSVAAAVVVAAVAFGGYLIISQRAGGSGRAAIPPASASPRPTESPTDGPTSPPQREHWLVAMVRRKTAVYSKPVASGALIKTYLPPKSVKSGYVAATVCLVRKVKETPAKVWYSVWLPMKPNGSRGWIPEGGVTLYPVYTKIVIDLSELKLSVRDGAGEVLGEYPVGVGTAHDPTPTGRFYVTAKVKPVNTNTAYGVLALAISAFSPTLADWPDDGQVAIHGTNRPDLIPGAISHGCVRLINHDVTAVSEQVAIGSPVVIQP